MDVSAIDDALFAREEEAVKKSEEEQFFAIESKAKSIAPARAAAQASVDAALKANIDKVDMLGAYLKAKFSLSKSDKPHLMKF